MICLVQAMENHVCRLLSPLDQRCLVQCGYGMSQGCQHDVKGLCGVLLTLLEDLRDVTEVSLSRRRFAAGSVAVAVAIGAAGTVASQVPKPTAEPVDQSVLQSLLALTPDAMGANPDALRETRFANLVPHLDHFGLEPLASGSDEVDLRLPAIFSLAAAPSDWPSMTADPQRWEDLFGFHPFGVRATLEQGPADDYFLLFRGEFDRDVVVEAMETTGYGQSGDAGDIWSLDLDDDARYDLAFDSGFIGLLFSYNHVAFLDDGVLAFSSELAYIEQAQLATRDTSVSMVGNPAVNALSRSMRDDVTRALVAPGSAFSDEVIVASPAMTPEQHAEVEQALEQIEDRLGPMPAIEHAILGRTAGGPYRESVAAELDTDLRATFLASIALSDPDAAATFLEIATRRFEVMHSLSQVAPYRELLNLESADVEDGLVVLTFAQPDEAMVSLFDLYYARDIHFLFY